jgi:hypothetical protein
MVMIVMGFYLLRLPGDLTRSHACSKVMLAEFNCTGPGSDAAKRVPWSRQFTMNEATKYLSVDFINGKDWLPAYYY